MPEFAELLIMMMALLALIKCGTTAVKAIHENPRWKKGEQPDEQGDKIVPPDNKKAGTEPNPAAFLGSKGATVVGIEHVGNQLGMLLKSATDGSYRLMTWTFKQGAALGFFPRGHERENGKPNTYPASYFKRWRSRMSWWFVLANLAGGADDQVLAQIDCTTKINQAQWNMHVLDESFDISPGWLERRTGCINILQHPLRWMEKVRTDFNSAYEADPYLPVVIWMSNALVWQGAGFKSKTEILNRLWRATGEGVFCMLYDLKKDNGEGGDRLTDLCLCAIKFLESELYVGKYFDLSTQDIQHCVKLWRRTYQVFNRAGMVRCSPNRKYEHVQIYADPRSIYLEGDPDSIYMHQWFNLVVNYSPKDNKWAQNTVLTEDKATPFCTDTSAGPINWHIRFDYPYFESHPEAEANLPVSLLCLARYRSKQQRPDSVADAKKPPPVKKRAAILEEHKAFWTALPEAEQGGSKKKRTRTKPQSRGGARDRTEANYSKPHWRKECWRLIERLDSQGLRGILQDVWETSLDHMQSA